MVTVRKEKMVRSREVCNAWPSAKKVSGGEGVCGGEDPWLLLWVEELQC